MADADASSTLERALALRRISGLEALDPELLTILAAHADVRSVAAGEQVARAPELVRPLLFVLEGRVGAVGQSLGPGAIVGPAAGLAPGLIDAVALEDSLTLALDMDGVTELCEEHLWILLAVTRGLARTVLERWREQLPPEAPQAPRVHGARGALDLGERIAFLASCPILAGIPVHALGQLAQGARSLALRPGEVLWSAGEPAGWLVAVVEGTIGAHTDRQRFAIGPGAIAGLLESIAAEPRWYTAETQTRVSALAIDIAAVFDVAEDDSETAADLLAALARSWVSARTPAA